MRGLRTQEVAWCLVRVGREMEVLGWLKKRLPRTSWVGGLSLCLSGHPSLGVPFPACLGAFILALDSCAVAHLETCPLRAELGTHFVLWKVLWVGLWATPVYRCMWRLPEIFKGRVFIVMCPSSLYIYFVELRIAPWALHIPDKHATTQR